MRVAAMNDAMNISREELRQIVREAVREAFDDVGLQVEDKDDIREARKDFDFIRSLRRNLTGIASKVGMAIVLSIVGGLITLLTFGLKAFLGR